MTPFKNLITATFVLLSLTSFSQTGTLDSVIHDLNGCWKWNYYYGGFAGLPPTPAFMNVKLEFRQDAQDSTNQTISCDAYKGDTLKFSGRCNIMLDTSSAGLHTLSCPIFDSIGIVGTPPIYFRFMNDTLLFPQEEFVDGFVYAFTKTCISNGIRENQTPGFEVFPNPASDFLSIKFQSKEPVTVSVFNSTSVKVLELPNFNSETLTLSASNLVAGIYFLQVQTLAGFSVRKLVIAR